jgi:hypothetical protein
MKIRSVLFIISILVLLGCNQHKNTRPDVFPCSSVILQFDGQPRDSSSLYVPAYVFETPYDSTIDSAMFHRGAQLQKEKNIKFSQLLFSFGEPLLSSKYLGQECYRLSMLQSGPPPVVIRILLSEDSVKVITKVGTDVLLGMTPKLLKENQKKYSKSVWIQLLNLLKGTDFWRLQPSGEYVIDGWQWILEGQRENGYKVVRRSVANDDRNKEFALVCLFILELGNIHEVNGIDIDKRPDMKELLKTLSFITE